MSGRAARAWRALMQACGTLAALVLGATALVVTADVALRNLLDISLPWAIEVSEYSLPAATFLAAPWILHHNQHVRLDALLNALPRHVARWLDRGADAAGLAISLVMVWYGLRTMVESARTDSMVMKALVFPEWWLYLPVPLCFALLAVEFVRRLASQPAAA